MKVNCVYLIVYRSTRTFYLQTMIREKFPPWTYLTTVTIMNTRYVGISKTKKCTEISARSLN